MRIWKSNNQPLPDLGELYEYYLGITPETREEFIDALSGYDDKERKQLEAKKRLEQEKATSSGYFSDEAIRKRAITSFVDDYRRLTNVVGYVALFKDLCKVADSEFEVKELPAEGSIAFDVEGKHIFFRGINSRGVPQFSIIDQYHLGNGELEWKRKVYGDNSPILRLGGR